MKTILQYALLICLVVLVLNLIWSIGITGFASWVLGFWIITLIMVSESLIRFLLSERRKNNLENKNN